MRSSQAAATATNCDSDEAADADVSDAHAGCADTDAATALRTTVALQNRARLELASAAGCSRAVPRHAVALLADLWGDANAAVADSAASSAAAVAARRRVAAACWGYHAQQRGCARAVCRADVADLVGLLEPAGWGAEPPQVIVHATRPACRSLQPTTHS